MKIYCSCCGKQAISENVSRYNRSMSILEGAKADCASDRCICGYCAEELDENGMFPEERAQIEGIFNNYE